MFHRYEIIVDDASVRRFVHPSSSAVVSDFLFFGTCSIEEGHANKKIIIRSVFFEYKELTYNASRIVNEKDETFDRLSTRHIRYRKSLRHSTSRRSFDFISLSVDYYCVIRTRYGQRKKPIDESYVCLNYLSIEVRIHRWGAFQIYSRRSTCCRRESHSLAATFSMRHRCRSIMYREQRRRMSNIRHIYDRFPKIAPSSIRRVSRNRSTNEIRPSIRRSYTRSYQQI